MKKLLYIILLLPLWATAQTNGTIQKTASSGTIRGSFGSLGLDTLPRVTGALVDGYILKYHAATNKWYASPDPTLVGLQDSLTKKANRTFDNVASGAIAKSKADTSANGLQTVSNFFPKGDTRYLKSVNISGTNKTMPVFTGTNTIGNSTIRYGSVGEIHFNNPTDEWPTANLARDSNRIIMAGGNGKLPVLTLYNTSTPAPGNFSELVLAAKTSAGANMAALGALKGISEDGTTINGGLMVRTSNSVLGDQDAVYIGSDRTLTGYGSIHGSSAIADHPVPFKINNTGLGDGIYVSVGKTLNYNFGNNADSDGWINYRGYNNGTTRFRGFHIANGKEQDIAFFDGPSRETLLYGNLFLDNTPAGAITDSLIVKNAADNFVKRIAPATSSNTASTVMARDASGDFSASAITLSSAVLPINATNTTQRELGRFNTSLNGGFFRLQSSGVDRGYIGNGAGVSGDPETSFGIRSEADLILMAGGSNIVGRVTSSGIAVTGNISASNLASGTYTPTLTNGSNVSSSTAGTGSYIRIGNQVTGYVDFIATGSSTALGDIGVSLPIASNFDSSTDVSGSLGIPRTGESTTSNGVAALNADTTNDRFAVVPSLVSGSPLTYRFHFQYTIK